MIREIEELRQRGQVSRRVDALTEPVEQWRAHVRAAARREGLQVHTFVIDIADSDAGNLTDRLVVAVRTDRPVDLRDLAAAVHDAAAQPHAWQRDGGRRGTDVTSLADARARRSRHPCRQPPEDGTGDLRPP